MEKIEEWVRVDNKNGDGDGYGDRLWLWRSAMALAMAMALAIGSGYRLWLWRWLWLSALAIGSGSGSGFGDGDGLKSINKQKVYIIDSTQTIIDSLHSNIAKGKIVNNDLTFTKCYVAKSENLFAHGKTLKEAVEQLRNKIFANLDVEERIEEFHNQFKKDKKYPGKLFYEWHNLLTGSCKMGRDTFVKDHNIDLENDKYTVEEFIKLTQKYYGGDIINRLKEEI
jgi:hypothetical protein